MREVRVVISLVVLSLALLFLLVSGQPAPAPVALPAPAAPPPVAEVSRRPGPPRQPPRVATRRRARAAQPAVVDSAPPLVIAEPLPPPVVTADPAAVPEPTPPPPEPPQAEPVEELARVENAPPPPAEEPAKDGNGEDIARAIAAAKRAAVRTCFEHELKDQPKLAGTVIVELDLAPPNRVDGLRVSDDLNRPTFTRCVTSAMQGVRFAALDEEVSVSVPYVLSPERK